jgi:hypothetical protein
MKNLKFLFTSLLLVALSFSVSAHNDVQHKTKTELVKHQSDVSTITAFANCNDFVFTIISKKVPSNSVDVPQIPFSKVSKRLVYGDVEQRNIFLTDSPYFYFYKKEQFFSIHNIILRENYLFTYSYKNVPTSLNKNSSFSSYSNYRNYSYSLCRLQ